MKFGFEETPPSERWLMTTLELVSRYGGTFYDAAYHATALVHGGVFVTAYAQYAARSKQGAASLNSRHGSRRRPQ